MFFYLGKDCTLLNKQRENLFTDLGWKQQDDILYKGYCLEYKLEENLDKILAGEKPQGIYCLIKDNKLYYPDMCPFPLYENDNVLTNLKLENLYELDKSRYSFTPTSKPLDTVVKNIIDIVAENLTKFELNIIASGGFDSMMLIAIAEYAKIPYTITITKPRTTFINLKQWEGTVEEYQSDLLSFCRENYWAYSIISNYKNEKILTVGFYGDEYFCRTIWQTHILARGFKKTLKEVVTPNDYLFEHLNKAEYEYLHRDNSPVDINDVKTLTLKTLGTATSWHFDNTIIFCPLLDKRIAENIWALDANILLESAPNALIQKDIIERTKPDVLLLIDNYKNNRYQTRHNFFKNIEKVKLPNCTNIIVH